MMIAKSNGNIKKTFIFDALNKTELKNDSTKQTQPKDFKTTGDSMMNNETYCFKFNDGFYFANFAYTPSSVVDNQLLFKGILGGNGVLTGDYCVVRANVGGTRASWESFLDVRKKLKSIEKIFRANKGRHYFHVPNSALASMEKTALPTKMASAMKGWRPPRTDEFVLVDIYQHPRGEIIYTDSLLSAVSHISLRQSKGKSYLTNFRAFTSRNNKVCITNAAVSTDIDNFHNNHRCNELCAMNIALNQSDPISVESGDFGNLMSYPISAPALGDFNFWREQPMIYEPPPYTEFPSPTAPSIYDIYPTFSNDFRPKNMSVG